MVKIDQRVVRFSKLTKRRGYLLCMYDNVAQFQLLVAPRFGLKCAKSGTVCQLEARRIISLALIECDNLGQGSRIIAITVQEDWLVGQFICNEMWKRVFKPNIISMFPLWWCYNLSRWLRKPMRHQSIITNQEPLKILDSLQVSVSTQVSLLGFN